MVKLSSFGPLILLLPGPSAERAPNLSCARLERGHEDMCEATDRWRDRDRGLGEEGENTSPGKAFEMNR
jgi:hypothetical protein